MRASILHFPFHISHTDEYMHNGHRYIVWNIAKRRRALSCASLPIQQVFLFGKMISYNDKWKNKQCIIYAYCDDVLTQCICYYARVANGSIAIMVFEFGAAENKNIGINQK